MHSVCISPCGIRTRSRSCAGTFAAAEWLHLVTNGTRTFSSTQSIFSPLIAGSENFCTYESIKLARSQFLWSLLRETDMEETNQQDSRPHFGSTLISRMMRSHEHNMEWKTSIHEERSEANTRNRIDVTAYFVLVWHMARRVGCALKYIIIFTMLVGFSGIHEPALVKYPW